MNWEFIGQATILTILVIVVIVFLWSAYETTQQKKHERQIELAKFTEAKTVAVEPGTIEVNGVVDPEDVVDRPAYGLRITPEGYDRTGDRGQ